MQYHSFHTTSEKQTFPHVQDSNIHIATAILSIATLPQPPFQTSTYRSRCCLLIPNISAVILQALPLSTSVDVARNNHTLLPVLVTTCSHAPFFSSHQQTDFIATTTSVLQPFKHRDNYRLISPLAREKAKRGQRGWGCQQVGKVPSGDTRREAISSCRGMERRSHPVPKPLPVSASSSTQRSRIWTHPNHLRAQTPLTRCTSTLHGTAT